MLVYIRGAGDLASGIAMRLYHAGMQVVMSDLPCPTAVRRTVSFSEAIRLGTCQVEDVPARRAETPEEIRELLKQKILPVTTDPEGSMIEILQPDAVIDAILAKKNLGTKITDAPIVIGVGPGFTAGEDCHAVIETKRGHTLGRVIRRGSAIANTGVPGLIAGYGAERVLRAPADGVFHPCHEIGDIIRAGEIVAYVDEVPLPAPIDGMIRGMLQDGIEVPKGMKSGDIDPRGDQADYTTISDKALAVGGGALEAVLWLRAEREHNTVLPAESPSDI